MLQYVPISVVHISRKSLKMSRWNREVIIIPIIITNRWQIILTSWTQPLYARVKSFPYSLYVHCTVTEPIVF